MLGQASRDSKRVLKNQFSYIEWYNKAIADFPVLKQFLPNGIIEIASDEVSTFDAEQNITFDPPSPNGSILADQQARPTRPKSSMRHRYVQGLQPGIHGRPNRIIIITLATRPSFHLHGEVESLHHLQMKKKKCILMLEIIRDNKNTYSRFLPIE